MQRLLVAYAVGTTTLLAIDFVWLSFVARGLYRREIGALLLDRPLIGPAAAFYLVYVVGVVVFAVTPALAAGSWVQAATLGALLGLIAYGTYDMTNFATLKNWSATISAVDMTWGAVLTAVTATAAYAAASRF